MPLDLTPLEKAIRQLETSLAYCRSDLARNDSGVAEQFRMAAIQAFEYTYELSWKMLKRYLEMTSPDPDAVDTLSFAGLVRTGCEQGLLRSDLARWKLFRALRGATSHAYAEEKAQEVFGGIPAFLDEARFLLEQLQEGAEES